MTLTVRSRSVRMGWSGFPWGGRLQSRRVEFGNTRSQGVKIENRVLRSEATIIPIASPTANGGHAVKRRRKIEKYSLEVSFPGEGGNFSLIACSGVLNMHHGTRPPSALPLIRSHHPRECRVLAYGGISVNRNSRPRIGPKPAAHSRLLPPNSNAVGV